MYVRTLQDAAKLAADCLRHQSKNATCRALLSITDSGVKRNFPMLSVAPWKVPMWSHGPIISQCFARSFALAISPRQ